jgi:hypothetical protein
MSNVTINHPIFANRRKGSANSYLSLLVCLSLVPKDDTATTGEEYVDMLNLKIDPRGTHMYTEMVQVRSMKDGRYKAVHLSNTHETIAEITLESSQLGEVVSYLEKNDRLKDLFEINLQHNGSTIESLNFGKF